VVVTGRCRGEHAAVLRDSQVSAWPAAMRYAALLELITLAEVLWVCSSRAR
jgi:hypothetical protein